MRVGIAAAGTGGHVYPALAVAEEIRSMGASYEDIVFFGGDRMEASTVPEAGFRLIQVDIHGIRRSLSRDNLTLPMKVLRARDTIVSAIVENGIDVMVVFGGYIAGPAALAASKTGIPLIVHEANAVPGVANRLVARRADTIFAAFAPATEKLPRAVVIGSPLRLDMVTFDGTARRAAARDKYGLPRDGLVLGIVGGSLGASFLNDVAGELAASTNHTYSIVHVTGTDHFEAISTVSNSVEGWTTIPFEHDMADLYAASDLVLSRGGAMTVSELQATRTPAVIVPLPAGGGYQERNAEDLVAAGGAIVVSQTEPVEVARRVEAVMGDSVSVARMRGAEGDVDHRKATAVMVAAVMDAANA